MSDDIPYDGCAKGVRREESVNHSTNRSTNRYQAPASFFESAENLAAHSAWESQIAEMSRGNSYEAPASFFGPPIGHTTGELVASQTSVAPQTSVDGPSFHDKKSRLIEEDLRRRFRPTDIYPLHLWYREAWEQQRSRRNFHFILALIGAVLAIRLLIAGTPLMGSRTVLLLSLPVGFVFFKILKKTRYRSRSELAKKRRAHFTKYNINPDLELSPIEIEALADANYFSNTEKEVRVYPGRMTIIDFLHEGERLAPISAARVNANAELAQRSKKLDSFYEQPPVMRSEEEERQAMVPATHEMNFQLFLCQVEALTRREELATAR